MLHEEVEKFSRLSGKDGHKTPISRIGGFLDGYETAKEEAKRTGNGNGAVTITYVQNVVVGHCSSGMIMNVIMSNRFRISAPIVE